MIVKRIIVSLAAIIAILCMTFGMTGCCCCTDFMEGFMIGLEEGLEDSYYDSYYYY